MELIKLLQSVSSRTKRCVLKMVFELTRNNFPSSGPNTTKARTCGNVVCIIYGIPFDLI